MKIATLVAGLIGSAAASAANAQIVMSAQGHGGLGQGTSSDAVLWDQSSYDASAAAGVDQEFGDFASYSSFLVNDISTGGAAWNVSKVTSYFTKGFGFWSGAITSGKLQVYSKSGALPAAGDVPPEYKVNISFADLGNAWAVSADTSGIAELQGISGDFWVGLTPTADFGVYGQEFHMQATSDVGNNTAFRNPGGAFGLGTGWTDWSVLGAAGDAAVLLEGTVVPAPGAMALLGLGGLAAARRRR